MPVQAPPVALGPAETNWMTPGMAIQIATEAWPEKAPMSHTSFFIFCWTALAALLFLPVSRLIWVMSVRRIERRLGSALPETERGAQLRRARVLAVFVVLAFSFLFNLQTLGPSGG